MRRAPCQCRRNGDDLLSIMHFGPSTDPAFFAASFAGFHFTDGTLRRGRGHLDRYWSVQR
jgi:hypothetical protein